MARLALTTIGILRERGNHPRSQGFFDRIASVLEGAYRAPGFQAIVDVERPDVGPPWTPPARFAGSEFTERRAVTLSLWEDVESAIAFSYRNLHGDALRLRSDWFETFEGANHAAWWHDGDEPPTWSDANARLARIWTSETPDTFVLQRPFGPDGTPYEVDRERIRVLAAGRPEA